MHTWHWQTWQGASYLTCSLLKDWAHGFFTQQFWSRPPETLVNILHPAAQVYRVKQVHGNTVLNVAELDPVSRPTSETEAEELPIDKPVAEADGLYTTAAEQAVWVCTADCTPVLIGDLATGRVAAIHAGWRGTAAAIVPRTISHLQAEGSQLQDLRIAMGPAITGEVYQVSTAVAAQVGATVLEGANLDSQLDHQLSSQPETADEILHQLHQLPDSPILEDPQPGRARLDVRKINLLQLQQLGIEPHQLSVAPYCTYQHPDLFFSYRRERQKKVQWSGIVSMNVA
jgi:polyphenol oxidase